MCPFDPRQIGPLIEEVFPTLGGGKGQRSIYLAPLQPKPVLPRGVSRSTTDKSLAGSMRGTDVAMRIAMSRAPAVHHGSGSAGGFAALLPPAIAYQETYDGAIAQGHSHRDAVARARSAIHVLESNPYVAASRRANGVFAGLSWMDVERAVEEEYEAQLLRSASKHSHMQGDPPMSNAPFNPFLTQTPTAAGTVRAAGRSGVGIGGLGTRPAEVDQMRAAQSAASATPSPDGIPAQGVGVRSYVSVDGKTYYIHVAQNGKPVPGALSSVLLHARVEELKGGSALDVLCGCRLMLRDAKGEVAFNWEDFRASDPSPEEAADALPSGVSL